MITSGDGFDYRELAQDLDNNFGKIERIKDQNKRMLESFRILRFFEAKFRVKESGF